MPISDNAASFLGIQNENDFYSAHYLAEVFEGDIKSLLKAWQEREENDADYMSPNRQLRSIANDYFAMRERSTKERNRTKAIDMQRGMQQKLLSALEIPWQPQNLRLDIDGVKNDTDLPVLAALPNAQQPQLIVVGGLDLEKEGTDPLLLKLDKAQFIGDGPHADDLVEEAWFDIISNQIFKARQAPRWVLIASDRQCVLIDRFKWLQNRFLRFDLDEILGRKDDSTLKATAALLHRDSLVPESGTSLLDSLDENSHKHAFGVSDDLKYALREAIELLGNEAAAQLIQNTGVGYTGKKALNPEELSRECLRYMYRLLFLFYIEARPELGYVPHTVPVWRKGYSLEALRDLEMVKLTSEESRNGSYFNASINKIFKLIHKGYNGERDQDTADQGAHHSISNTFEIKALDSHLFDPKRTPCLNKVKFTNATLQRVIELMSLTRKVSGRGKKRRGRVSYAQLGINQLGAVYEALLSYRGFFAHQDLYEVKKVKDKPTELETGYFVTADEIGDYKEDEKVTDTNDDGHKTLRVHKQGTFIYRLAGRDREKSASYYTPEVLTKCLVKYTLKERLKNLTADEILALTVCEPAMGSAAFLNEAVNQLAEAYLTLKQQELNTRIPHEEYREALQLVKMHIADHNVYGVDLNPIAVELAEVSLWLNALSESSVVPWFGYQLFNGNSLIGARRQVYLTDQLITKDKKDRWFNHEPKRLDPQNPKRKDGEIYHFLLPDEGMVAYKDKTAKALKPEEFKLISKWKKEFTKRLSKDEVLTLEHISKGIDKLWQTHTEMLTKDRVKTEDRFEIWGQRADQYYLSTQEKDQIRSSGIFNSKSKYASPYRRLKLVMDYWCSLWFWPIEQAHLLPRRDQWLFEINLIIQGQSLSTQPVQSGLDFDDLIRKNASEGEQGLFSAEPETTILSDEERAAIKVQSRHGELDIAKLFQQFPRLDVVNNISEKQKFFHWELSFADIFAARGGFDIMLGNPPWLKVEWNESGVLGDFNPQFVLSKLSATAYRDERTEAFSRSVSLELAWFQELTEAEGTQSFLNAYQNYSELKGVQTNLYKCFLPQAWRWGNERGISGFLHPEGTYDDPKGGKFREYIYPRLKAHFQFHNELKLFSEVHHATTFSINVYEARLSPNLSFLNIANLFGTSAIDQSLNHNAKGPVPGIKDDQSKWNTLGHGSRVLHITRNELEIFSKLYDEDATPGLQARLPAIHSQELISVLEKFAKQPTRLGDLKGEYYSLEMWHETNAQNDETIKRETEFPDQTSDWIVSGPHFFVGNPLYKTPRSVCNQNSHYDVLDLTELAEDYLPRTNYIPACDAHEYAQRTPVVPWLDEGETKPRMVTDYFRFANRRMYGSSAERSLIGTVIPKSVAHINTVVSTVIKTPFVLANFAAATFSIVFDFFLKSTGRSDLYGNQLIKFPYFEKQEILVRGIGLTCLSKTYSTYWHESYRGSSKLDSWGSNSPILNANYFLSLSQSWSFECALRTDFERRQALLEIDVLVAMELDITFKELCTIYLVQFPVMRQYERETYYDLNGRIIFTPSKGLIGVGLPRSVRVTDTPVTIEYPDGRIETIQLGWQDIVPEPAAIVDGKRMEYGNPNIPDGTKIHRTIIDDTLPGGPRKKIITYIAPFYLPDREDDYRVAWEVFTNRFAKKEELGEA
jgi:type I restriction-modification system DNA methylase subunit